MSFIPDHATYLRFDRFAGKSPVNHCRAGTGDIAGGAASAGRATIAIVTAAEAHSGHNQAVASDFDQCFVIGCARNAVRFFSYTGRDTRTGTSQCA